MDKSNKNFFGNVKPISNISNGHLPMVVESTRPHVNTKHLDMFSHMETPIRFRSLLQSSCCLYGFIQWKKLLLVIYDGWMHDTNRCYARG